MKRILFDTNVLLDVLLDRHPHVEGSTAAWAAVETGISEGMLTAHAVMTIHCLVQKEIGATKAKRIVSAILGVFGVAAVDGAVVQEALQLPVSDFEQRMSGAAAPYQSTTLPSSLSYDSWFRHSCPNLSAMAFSSNSMPSPGAVGSSR